MNRELTRRKRGSARLVEVRWIEIKVSADAATREAVANFLVELGSAGVREEEGESGEVMGYLESERRADWEPQLRAYLASLGEIFPDSPAPKLSLAAVEEVNWAERWKAFYRPQKLSERFFLRPLWDNEAVVPPGMTAIVMDPGQAFGTGLHESTQLALRLMEEAVERREDDVRHWRVLDVGTGSGILAIAATKLGAARVVGVDNDPEVIPIARDNCSRNGCPSVELFPGTIETVEEEFELVVANILLETHKQCLRSYRARLGPGAELVLSGLLRVQQAEMTTALREAGLEPVRVIEAGEWIAIAAREASVGGSGVH